MFKPRIIVIDPGHGGKDPGAVDGINLAEKDTLNTHEAKINLAVALKLKAKLEAKGYGVILTRSKDQYITLQERCRIANNADAMMFISIHCNSVAKASARGVETLYHPKSSKGFLLAQLVQTELVKVMTTVNRGLKSRDNLYVLNGTRMPAILIELAFVSNPEDEKLLNSDTFQEKIAGAIVNGVVKYR